MTVISFSKRSSWKSYYLPSCQAILRRISLSHHAEYVSYVRTSPPAGRQCYLMLRSDILMFHPLQITSQNHTSHPEI